MYKTIRDNVSLGSKIAGMEATRWKKIFLFDNGT